MNRFTTTFMVACLVAGAGCKKKDDASGSGKAVETPGGAAAPKADQPAAGGACAAGFTDPGIGACVKLPAGLKPDPSAGQVGGKKRAAFVGEGHTTVDLLSEDYSQMFWDDAIKDLLAGGGFGGKLAEQGKIGSDGVWGVFDADDGRTKVVASHSHGKTKTVHCIADHDVGSKDKPSLEEMAEICKTIVAQ